MSHLFTFISLISVGMAILLIVLIFIIKKRKEVLGVVEIKRNDFDEFWEKIYFFLLHFVITKRSLNQISNKLHLIGDFGITQIRCKSAQLFLLSYIPLIVLGAVLSFFVSNVYIILFIVLAFASVANTITDYFVNRIIAKLLEQMVDFNEELRKRYLNIMMVDEAFYNAIEQMQVSKYKEIIKEASRIYDILISSNGEYKLNQYYLSAPNKYLKLLAGIAFITKEYGDSQVDGGSLLVRSITQITNELRNEILFRNRLNIGIKSLNAIVLLPVFFIHPLRVWASENFFPMARFYDGPMGFVAQMFVFATVLLCFRILKRLQRFGDEFRDVSLSTFYKKLYKKMRKIVDFLIPNQNSKFHLKKKSLIEKAMIFEKMEYHYTKKLVFGFAFGVISLIFIVIYLYINSAQIISSPVIEGNFLGGQLRGKSLEKALNLRDLDNFVITRFEEFKKLHSEDLDSADVTDLQVIEGILNEEYDMKARDVHRHAVRIHDKWLKLNSSGFSAYHVLIIYVAVLSGFFVPDLNLLILHGLIKIDMVSEVVKFQIIVGILVHVKNMDVETLLEWLERFSYVYKKPIQKALMEYDAGARSALEKLRDSSDYYEFQNLIQHLISCVEDLSLIEAFGEFESEKQYYVQKRFDESVRVVEQKINIGKIFGFLPIYVLIIVYFIIPLIYVSVYELKSYFLLLK